MPLWVYLCGLVGFVLWGCLIYGAAGCVPWPSAWSGFIGTMLTLLPAVIDLLRKFYIERLGQTDGPDWVEKNLFRALLGYETLYAVLFALGLTGIALGFAQDLRKEPTTISPSAASPSAAGGKTP